MRSYAILVAQWITRLGQEEWGGRNNGDGKKKKEKRIGLCGGGYTEEDGKKAEAQKCKREVQRERWRQRIECGRQLLCQMDCNNVVMARRDVMPGSCTGKRRGKTKQNGDGL